MIGPYSFLQLFSLFATGSVRMPFPEFLKVPHSLTLSLLHNLVLTLVVSILSYQVGFFYLQFSAETFIVLRSMSMSLQTSLTLAFNDHQYVPLFSLIPHHTSLYTGLSLLGKWEDVGEDCVFLTILFSEFVMSRYLFS